MKAARENLMRATDDLGLDWSLEPRCRDRTMPKSPNALLSLSAERCTQNLIDRYFGVARMPLPLFEKISRQWRRGQRPASIGSPVPRIRSTAFVP